MRRLLLGPVVVALGCTGVINGERSPAPSADSVGVSGARRLSRVELDATLRDLLGESMAPAQMLLPADSTDPFDNDYHQQLASGALIEAVEQLAVTAADHLLADPVRRAQLVPCLATGPDDAGCLRAFIDSFGRRVFRRPLTADEVTNFLSLQALAIEDGSFDTGVKLVMRAMLQEPEFLYRVELGRPSTQPGVFKLSTYELATRMSYFVIGSTPPDWLLDAAREGGLDTKDGLRATAAQLLQDPRAHAQVERFHSLWLGYHRLPHSADLVASMQAESNALVDRVAFSNADYLTLFTSTEAFVNAQLAAQYELTNFTGGTGFAWTPYGTAPRRGLLSHGAVLSQGVKFSDSSPTQRGIFVRNRLLCQEVPPPPPNVNVDQAPVSTSPCKIDRYSTHASNGGCKSCHQNLDPIGFGLERYDRAGKFRMHDDNLPSCPIEGKGHVTGATDLAFEGPSGLADALIASGQFEHCIVTQVFRFANGRREKAEDAALISKLTSEFTSDERKFQSLLIDLITDDTFGFRRDEEL